MSSIGWSKKKQVMPEMDNASGPDEGLLFLLLSDDCVEVENDEILDPDGLSTMKSKGQAMASCVE